MRPIARRKLERATVAALKTLTHEVARAADPKATAERLWDGKPARVFADVRDKLEKMASGRSRCMYCEDSFGADIEHFYPKARYPRRAFQWKNYLLACSHCNSNRKRSAFPFQNGRPALIDPTSDRPAQHLAFLPSSGEFRAIGPKGQSSIDVFGLNDLTTPRKLPQARKGAFLKLQLLLEEYDRCLGRGDTVAASFVKQTVQDEPFPAVLGWLVGISRGPAASTILRPGVEVIIKARGVGQW